MRRRAEGDDLDSLNLLLDTVCNMFGIFIFSALIVAVMAMTRSAQIVAVDRTEPRPGDTERRILVTRESIEELSRQLEEGRKSRPAVLTERAREATTLMSAAERELAIRQSTLVEYRERISSDAQLLERLRADVPRLGKQIEQIQSELARARQLKEVDVRTPLRRALEGRIPVQVVLHEGRAFILNPWADSPPDRHPCDIWCEWNPQAVVPEASGCDPTRFSCTRGGAIEIHRRVQLRSGGGIPADSTEALAQDPEWRRFLAALDPQRHVVSLYCTRSGFRAFGPVRGEIVSRGIPYNAEPTVLNPFYEDAIIEGTPTGQ